MKYKGKSIEQTIREVQQRYKNVPSPLSEQAQRNRQMGVVPQQQMARPNNDPRSSILGDFRPNIPNRPFA